MGNTCIVKNCDIAASRSKATLCEMHYMRMYRNGTFEKIHVPSERLNHSHGYIINYAPSHPLAQQNGRVFEHRRIYHDCVSKTVDCCSLCGGDISWGTCHIDHINNNKQDNRPENLRATCTTCNTRRGRRPDHEYPHCMAITAMGETKTPAEWARDKRVHVAGATIRRRKKQGMSDFDALFAPKKTHNACNRGWQTRSV